MSTARGVPPAEAGTSVTMNTNLERSYILMAALSVAQTAQAQGAPLPRSVAVEMSALDAATYSRIGGADLEKALIVRLVGDGFAVVNLTQRPGVVVTVEQR